MSLITVRVYAAKKYGGRVFAHRRDTMLFGFIVLHRQEIIL